MQPISLEAQQRSKRVKLGIRFFWLGLSMPLCAGAVKGVFRYYHPPLPLSVGLALLPLLPLFAALHLQKQALVQSDELARHITRDAFAFTFYALFGVFICTDLLCSGGILPAFVWETQELLLLMLGTFGLSYGWSTWRYR